MKQVLPFLVAVVALAQQGAVIQTETRVVLVDAIVTGKNGAYVRDLTAKDFRVWQDNKEQTIKSLSLESASTASQPRPMVLFFDESSMEARDQVQLRPLASSFIDAEMGPNRKMAVVSYNGGLRVTQNFTDNAGRLKDALPHPDSRVPDAEAQAQGRPQLGRAPAGTSVDNAAARNMIRSLRELGKSLNALPGRKIVVLFLGQLASSSTQRSDLREAIEECNKSGVALYPVDVRPVSVQTDSGDQTFLPGERVGAMGRQRGGPRGDPDDAPAAGITDSGAGSQQLLYEMANGTGGLVVRNSNDLLGGLQQIAREQDEYYVLSYTPPESKEGSCHALRVKVDRGGTNVRARSTWCTEKPLDLLAGTIAGQDLEKRAAASPSSAVGNLSAAIELPYFYVSPNVARVHVAMEITPGALKFENQKGRLHAEINLLGIASTADGGVRARFSDNLKFDFDNEAQVRGWRLKPLHYEKEFRIASGQYNFTMAFGQSGDSGGFGKVEKALLVDAWDGGALALSGLALSREAHPAADLGLGMSIEGRTPLVAGGTQVVPSGSEVFGKSESGSFYVEVYDPDPASVSARVRVLDRQTGQAKWDSGLTKFPLPVNGGKPSMPAIGNLPLDALAPGSYRLEVAASDSAGKNATQTADFEIR